MTKKNYCTVGQFKAAVSEITGHSLWINISDGKFQVPADVSLDCVRAAALLQEAYWEKLSCNRRPKNSFRDALLTFTSVQSIEDYCSAIDKLIAEMQALDELAKERKALRGVKARGLDFLMRLWALDLLAWPAFHPFGTVPHYNYNEFTLLGHIKWFEEVRDASASKTRAVKVRAATVILRSAMTTIGISEIGDLTQLTVDLKRWGGLTKPFYGAIKCLMTAQMKNYGKAAVFPNFKWAQPLANAKAAPFVDVLAEAPEISLWVDAFTNWLENTRGNLRMRRTAASHFLAYLRGLTEIPADPVAYCRRDFHPNITFNEWLDATQSGISLKHRAKLINNAHEFFEGLVTAKLTLEDDFGRPVVSPEHVNPITRLRTNNVRAQTHREAMPTRYISELVALLTENDFEWARKSLTDYFSWYNEAEMRWERVWSPVRVIALLVKLHLPLRTFQVRMLDSGECDHEVYRAGVWTKNQSSLAPKWPTPLIRRGVLRRFEDKKVNRTFTGFYINTNKTADRMKDQEDRGYEIPWQNEPVIKYLEMLRDWQERYNPISAPISWAEINERELLAQYSPEMLKLRGEAAFLFRDPCGPDRRYPVRDSKVYSIWNALLAELELRVFERGERLPDGSKITFIKTREARGRASSPVYDLHTLRVSLLTAYATDGGVPIEVLSKCVAGHASLLMTIYYIKTGPAYITEQLALAQERMAAKSKDNLMRFMMDAKLEQIEEAVAFNDGDGARAVLETSPGSWVVGDKGICPVGGNRCSIGGPKVTNMDCRANDHAPVPGGAKNCVRCRFFITGPAFLGGMVAHFNAVGLRLSEASTRYRDQTAAIQKIEDEIAGSLGDGADSRKLDLAYERQDQVMKEVDEMAANWHAAYKLVERCKALAVSSGRTSGVSLVLAGTQQDLEVAIEMTSDFDVINAVCQVANVYPSEDTTLANLRRSRILDAMLARNGCRPVFATLSDAEALGVGNEFVSFLQARLGRVETSALMEGRRMLDMSGIATEATNLLSQLTREPVQLSTLMEAQAGIQRLPSEVM